MKKIFALVLCFLFLVGCKNKTLVENKGLVIETIISNIENFDDFSKKLINNDFLEWFSNEFGEEKLNILKMQSYEEFNNEDWHRLSGNTAIVLSDMYSGALNPKSVNYRNDIRVIDSRSDDVTIRIVGDVSFADNWKIAPVIDSSNKGIYSVLSSETVNVLKTADIFLLNNEFTYSNRGAPLKGKMYTFRANPKRAKLLHDIGADIVSIANNHAYDFGPDAFADTLQTLREEKVPYIGGGENINEASKPYYFIINGRKFAFSAATRAEKNILTPAATETTSGVMRIYNPEQYIKTIQLAENECDYNIAYVHWGKEGFHDIEGGLYELGSRFIDSGADIVVGAHAHLLQGIQYYKDIPIVYNLGNFIFNDKNIDTGILEINISEDKIITYKFIPAIQKDCFTKIVNGDEKDRILKLMQDLSVDVNFDENGVFTKN